MEEELEIKERGLFFVGVTDLGNASV